jgi:hypothetical protein
MRVEQGLHFLRGQGRRVTFGSSSGASPQASASSPSCKPNGVVERLDRTLKEQAIHGRVFRNVEEVRSTVTAFKDRANRHWRLEKLGF